MEGAAPVERWIVEEALPADRGARLFDIGPHHCTTGARLVFLQEVGRSLGREFTQKKLVTNFSLQR